MIEGQGSHRRPVTTQDAWTPNQTAAWRAPGATRFDSRPANDFVAEVEGPAPVQSVPQRAEAQPLPVWFGLVVGAVLAALLGAVIGGMLSL